MKRQWVGSTLIVASLAAALAGCAGAAEVESTPTAVVAIQPTIAPAEAVPTATEMPPMRFDMGVTGSGVVRAAQDADLFFQVPGTVDQVLTEEGAQVQEGDLLAILDVRSFDLEVRRAEAALASAEAQESGLTEEPRAAEVAAANAQIAQARAALAQLQAGAKPQDIESAEASVAAAEANLAQTRDQLSAAKTNAELQLEQAANQLRNAQAEYSRIYWENRELQDQLRRFGRELSQEARDREEAALRAVQSAEAALEQARVSYEQAQQAEVEGIRAAEQQVVQARAALEKLLLPPDADQVAAAESAIAQAAAARDRLIPAPFESQQEQAAAAISQAQVALEIARINRERAELRAPFDGVIATVGIDPGDPAQTAGTPAIRIVDVANLRIEVQISDTDIGRVELGQAAEVRADAMPEKVYPGTVSFIAPTATVTGNVRTYLVRIQLDDQAGLRDGMSVRVDIQQ